METTVRILRLATVIIVVCLLGGLAGWYLFIQTHRNSVVAVDTARGLGTDTPAFHGTTGSTAVNVATGAALTATTTTMQPFNGRLFRVDQEPIAGFSFMPANTTAATSSAHLLLVERANGYVFDTDIAAHTITRLSNTLLPKIYEAIFLPRGSMVLLRSLDGNGTIKTALAHFETKGSTSSLPAALMISPLADNIRAAAIDAPNNQLFYLTAGASGSTGVLMPLPPSKQKPKNVFSSIIRSWIPLYGNGRILLLQAPADGTPGYAYTASSGGALMSFLGPLPGLQITLHPTENAVLYSTSAGGRLALFAQIGKGAPTALNVATVAEKCVWAPGKSLIIYCAIPDSAPATGFINDWYRGALHPADRWWQIDLSSGTAQLLFTPMQALDVHDPQIDASGNYIAFVNGGDASLWVLRVVQ